MRRERAEHAAAEARLADSLARRAAGDVFHTYDERAADVRRIARKRRETGETTRGAA